MSGGVDFSLSLENTNFRCGKLYIHGPLVKFNSRILNKNRRKVNIIIRMRNPNGEMNKELINVDRAIRSALREKKHVLILAGEFSIASELSADKQRLWTDWADLELDNYLKDAGRFRQRRFGLFYMLPSTGELLPLQLAAYIQSREINTYAGGIAREFAPLVDTTLTNQFLHELIKFNFRQFPVDSSRTHQPWEIDVHQFRIVASQDEQGQPTPEGIHHDGDDFNCIHLIGRQNATCGINTVYDNDLKPLTSCTLLQPMDSIMVWDPHVMHGVTPIHPENPSESAIRDVLVIGYNHRPDLKRPVGKWGCI